MDDKPLNPGEIPPTNVNNEIPICRDQYWNWFGDQCEVRDGELPHGLIPEHSNADHTLGWTLPAIVSRDIAELERLYKL